MFTEREQDMIKGVGWGLITLGLKGLQCISNVKEQLGVVVEKMMNELDQ
jgi:hypothetical protein